LRDYDYAANLARSGFNSSIDIEPTRAHRPGEGIDADAIVP
jgi:hypothetical protein